MLDHMLDGRFIFGISPGGLATDAEVFESLHADRPAMFLEGINHILKIWNPKRPTTSKASSGTSRPRHKWNSLSVKA